MGTKRNAINGSVLVLASRTLRMTKPQPPPVRCWSIKSASEPTPIPVQNGKPIRYEWKNCRWSMNAPMTRVTIAATPTNRARRWNPARDRGGSYEVFITYDLRSLVLVKEGWRASGPGGFVGSVVRILV